MRAARVWTPSSGVAFKLGRCEFVRRIFREDPSRRVAGAKKQDLKLRSVWFHGILTLAGTFVLKRVTDPTAIGAHRFKTLEIGTKPFVCGCTVLQTFEIGFQFERRFGRKAVNSPCSMAGTSHHSLFTEIGEMLGHLGLRKTENFLKVADTQRTAS
jgi:hypothetical protein